MAAVTDDGPILFFDGVCNVCNATVRFVLTHERAPCIRFASLQSDVARSALAKHQLRNDLATLVFIEGDAAWTRSAAVVRVLRHLRFPWSLLAVIWLVPRPLRDVGYDLFARLRYRLFGRRETCMVPTAELRARFLA